MSVLEVSGLTAGYGGSVAIRDIALDVDEGAIHTIIGPNGAGKTTMVSAIAGLLPIAYGRIVLTGRGGSRDVTAMPSHRRARLGIRLVPQGARLFGRLTVAEHLDLAAGRDRRAVRSILDQLPALARRSTHRPDQLSGGEAAMLAIARALLGRPALLLLDEPADGLAPAVADALASLVTAAAAEGTAVLATASRAADVHPKTARLTRLRHGRVDAADGSDEADAASTAPPDEPEPAAARWTDLITPHSEETR